MLRARAATAPRRARAARERRRARDARPRRARAQGQRDPDGRRGGRRAARLRGPTRRRATGRATRRTSTTATRCPRSRCSRRRTTSASTRRRDSRVQRVYTDDRSLDETLAVARPRHRARAARLPHGLGAARLRRLLPQRDGRPDARVGGGQRPRPRMDDGAVSGSREQHTLPGAHGLTPPQRSRLGRSAAMPFRHALAVALAAAVAGVLVAAAPAAATRGGPVRVNDLQVIGTHNSYKREISEAEQNVYEAAIQKPGDYDQFLAYSHASLPRQLGAAGDARPRARPVPRPGGRPVRQPARAPGRRAPAAHRPRVAAAGDQGAAHRRPRLQVDVRAARDVLASRCATGRSPTAVTCRC